MGTLWSWCSWKHLFQICICFKCHNLRIYNPTSCIFTWMQLLSIIIDHLLQKVSRTESFPLQLQSYHMDSQVHKEQHLGCWCAEISACLAEESYLGVFVGLCVCSSWLVNWGKTCEEGRQWMTCWLVAQKRQDPKRKCQLAGGRCTSFQVFTWEQGEPRLSPLASSGSALGQHAAFETPSEMTCSISQPDLVVFLWLCVTQLVWGSWYHLSWCW